MLNRLIMLLAARLLISTHMVFAESKMKLDADADGKVSYDEYRTSKEKAHERQFKKMDNNGDGFVDASEKYVVFNIIFEHFTVKQCRSCVRTS